MYYSHGLELGEQK